MALYCLSNTGDAAKPRETVRRPLKLAVRQLRIGEGPFRSDLSAQREEPEQLKTPD
jgi:hypothetical protein